MAKEEPTKNHVNIMEKQLPNDPRIEMAVIGLCLEDSENYEAATRVLQASQGVFFQPINNDIFGAMSRVVSKRQAIDVIAIKVELERAKKWHEDHYAHLAACMEQAISSRGDNIESMVVRLSEMSMKREIIKTCTEATAAAYDPSSDAAALVSTITAKVTKMENPLAANTFQSIGELFDPLLREMEADQASLSTGKKFVLGQTTGLTVLDYIMGGDMGGELTTIAARPGGSKSTFVLNSAQAGALQDCPQAIVSLEMDNKMQLKRMIADQANIPNHHLKQAKISEVEWARMHAIRQKMIEMPIHLDFCPGLDVVKLEAKCRRIIRERGVKRIFIDYLQLMDKPKGGANDKTQFNSFNEKVSQITARLKQLAGEWDVPIILLSQMSRDIEKRAGQRLPMLSDLRDSGSIEQDSNNVIFLDSPSEIDKSIKNYSARFYPGMQIHEIRRLSFAILAKQRNGVTATVPFWNDRQFCRFSDIREIDVYKRLEMFDTLFGDNDDLMTQLGWTRLDNQTEIEFEGSSRGGGAVVQNSITESNGAGSDFFPF